jgi:chemotaxis protein methyltransferase CheR
MSAVAEAPIAETLDALETDLLLEGLVRRWGYDLRGFDRRVARRHLQALLRARGAGSLSALQGRVLRDSREADLLVSALCRPCPRLFQDPGFWFALRRRAVPYLRTYPSPRVWVPSCGRGEDAFGLAIVLDEEGLGDRAEIYATDLAPAAVLEARAGLLPRRRLAAAEARHARAGGVRPLAAHFEGEGRRGSLHPRLRARIVLGTHSLATDGPINEFQYVHCRGLLRRFGPLLRRRVLDLVLRSLCPLGLVALDDVPADPRAAGLTPFVPEEGIWRRAS